MNRRKDITQRAINMIKKQRDEIYKVQCENTKLQQIIAKIRSVVNKKTIS